MIIKLLLILLVLVLVFVFVFKSSNTLSEYRVLVIGRFIIYGLVYLVIIEFLYIGINVFRNN